MSATATPRAGTLTAAQVAEIRRWAQGILGGRDESLREAARAVVRLADEAERLRGGDESWDWDEQAAELEWRDELDRCRALVARLATLREADPDVAAATRAIRLLCDDVASLRGDDVGAAPPPADAAAAEPPARPAGLRGLSPLVPAAALLPVACLVVLALALLAAAPDLEVEGPREGALVGKAALASLTLELTGDPDVLAGARWTLDGDDVTDAVLLAGRRATLRPRGLSDGRHELEVRVGGLMLWSGAAAARSFIVDTVPPVLRLAADVLLGQVRAPFVVQGEIDGAATLHAGGKLVPLRDGSFELRYPEPPARPLRLVARDAAGNEAVRRVTVLLVPRLPSNPIRAVHVTADAWANAELRAGILRLVDERRINAVELDLKDESGVVGWNPPVPLAREIGASRRIYDLEEAVALLHGKGVRVIGRLVAFRDPILAEAAWRAGKRAQVIQTAGGEAYSGGYGGFTNFANPVVRRYNIDVALAAARLGVDDILYDYVRRPDGPLDTMRFPGLRGSPEASMVSFLAETRQALAPTGAFLGASVFGIAVTRPEEIAQEVTAMAREVDYIAPMLYPSHWGPGEYGVDRPNAQPYQIVLRSLEDYQAAVSGTGARVLPWLQDFSLGVEYGPGEVRAQIRAARAAGIREFLLWDPAVTYTAKALSRVAELPATGEKPAASGPATSILPPNEGGVVPVLMFHQLLPDGGGEYDLTPGEFRRLLERLYREGYRPARASDLANGTLDVPRGTTPVVFTFDDATTNQAALLGDGRLDPETAAGIMVEFARTHPGFEPAGTFYVNRAPFSAGERTGELLLRLRELGFEVGNHTRDHLNLGTLGAREVQEQIVLGSRVIHEYLPDEPIETIALPMGVPPQRPELVLAGRWDGEPYRFKGVLLVGAEPAPSPFARAFDPAGIPRIRATLDRGVENGSADWLERLRSNPGLRYVSDGDPGRIAVPASRQEEIADGFRDRVETP